MVSKFYIFILGILLGYSIYFFNIEESDVTPVEDYLVYYEEIDYYDEYLSYITELETEELNNKIDLLFSAMCIVESQNQEDAVGDDGKALGILQIHDICVREINNKCYQYNRFTWTDALSRNNSEIMFKDFAKWLIDNKYYKYENEMCEFEFVSRTWNGGYNFSQKSATIGYWNKVEEELLKLQDVEA